MLSNEELLNIKKDINALRILREYLKMNCPLPETIKAIDVNINHLRHLAETNCLHKNDDGTSAIKKLMFTDECEICGGEW